LQQLTSGELLAQFLGLPADPFRDDVQDLLYSDNDRKPADRCAWRGCKSSRLNLENRSLELHQKLLLSNGLSPNFCWCLDLRINELVLQIAMKSKVEMPFAPLVFQ